MLIDVFIHAQWNKYSKEFSYSSFACDMTEYGYVLIEKQQISFETQDEKHLRVQAASALLAQKNKLLAETHVEALRLQAEVDELLAIEYKEKIV